MLQVNKTISVTGFSSIEVDENGAKTQKQIAYMNANIPNDGDFSINKSIQEKEVEIIFIKKTKAESKLAMTILGTQKEIAR